MKRFYSSSFNKTVCSTLILTLVLTGSLSGDGRFAQADETDTPTSLEELAAKPKPKPTQTPAPVQTPPPAPLPATDPENIFVFDGSQNTFEFELSDNTTKDAFKEVVVPKTCTKEEVIGYERVCRTVNEPKCETRTENECRTEYDRECTPTTRRECRTVNREECNPITREECSWENHPICTPTTRRECHNENRRECTPTTRRECHDVTRRDCTPTTRRECSTVNRRQCNPTSRQECRTESTPVCTPTTRRECRDETQCRDVADQICRGTPPNQTCTPTRRRVCENTPVCRDVPDQVCRNESREVCRTVTDQNCVDIPEQVCRDVADQVCRDRTENVCRNVPDEVCRDRSEQVCENVPDEVCRDNRERVCHPVTDPNCRTIPEQVCENVPDEVCRNIPREVCEDVAREHCVNVPRQVCENVPKTRTVPYDCSYKETVPNGKELVFQVKASVHVEFEALASGDKPEEAFKAVLKAPKTEKGKPNFDLLVEKLSHRFLILNESSEVKEVPTSNTQERRIEARFKLKLIPLAELTSGTSIPMSDFKFQGSQLSFVTGPVFFPEFYSVALKITRVRWWFLKDREVISRELEDDEVEMGADGTRPALTEDHVLAFRQALDPMTYSFEPLALNPDSNQSQGITHSRVIVDFSKMKLTDQQREELSKKKYIVKATLRFRGLSEETRAKIVNPKDIPAAKQVVAEETIKRIP